LSRRSCGFVAVDVDLSLWIARTPQMLSVGLVTIQTTS
jgi:hypothetical protein